MERFTNRARWVISLSQNSAELHDHGSIDVPHLLMGLWQEENGRAGKILRMVGVGEADIQALIDKGQFPPSLDGEPELSLGVKRVLELSVDSARKSGQHYIGTEHLLTGIMNYNNTDTKNLFQRVGLTEKRVESLLVDMTHDRESQAVPRSNTATHDPIQYYIRNNQLSANATLVFELARHATLQTEDESIDYPQILYALWQVQASVAGRIMHDIGVTVDHFAPAVKPTAIVSDPQRLVFTSFNVQRVLNSAMVEVRRYGDTQITPEHVLLALLRLRHPFVVKVFTAVGIPLEDVIRRVRWQMRGGRIEDLRAIPPRTAWIRRWTAWFYYAFGIDIFGDFSIPKTSQERVETTPQDWMDNLDVLITDNPQSWVLYEMRAIRYAELKQYAQAALDYGKAADWSPHPAPLRTKQAWSLLQSHNYALALVEFDRLVEKYPNNSDIYWYRCEAKLNLNDIEGATADCEMACRLDPTDAKSFTMRARLHMLKGEFELALADCERAKRVNVAHPMIYVVRGLIALERGDLPLAEIELKIALKRGEEQASVQSVVGLVHLRQGDLDKALQAANKALELSYREEMGYYVRGKVFVERGQSENAVADFQSAIQHWANPDVPFWKPYVDEMRAYLADRPAEKPAS